MKLIVNLLWDLLEFVPSILLFLLLILLGATWWGSLAITLLVWNSFYLINLTTKE